MTEELARERWEEAEKGTYVDESLVAEELQKRFVLNLEDFQKNSVKI